MNRMLNNIFGGVLRQIIEEKKDEERLNKRLEPYINTSGATEMNNDQEWNQEKQTDLNNVIYKCFLDGFCTSANIDFFRQYTKEDKKSLKEAKTAARAYVKYREGKQCEL
ncbi:unnamed protein product [marine sediment metagenome]|uniref:Uncharacterized protein n=1 Tax=marine sediment metagenome TaxID=412755 RepID=X0WLE5_9ZZZZ